MKLFYSSLICIMMSTTAFTQEPVKLAIAGLSHGHVHWIFNREAKNDIQLVGIYEEDKELIRKFKKQYGLDSSLFYDDLDKMLEKTKPEAVSAFGAVNEHLNIVKAAAPKKIHVMVEKPLAFSYDDATEIQSLATKHGIHVLTNFETSWYSSNQYVNELVEKGQLGEIRKVLVNDGHEGPKEIGVSDEFLEILTNPTKNGAGALVDFGCYGANLMTWLMDGKKPLSVTAVVNQNKPDIYKNVDDEASIILQYPKAQCIIQASWNWPYSRKDMSVYGTNGYAVAEDATTVLERIGEENTVSISHLNPREEPYADPFSYLAAVVNGSIELTDNSLYGLPINVITVQILDAAIESSKTKETVFLNAK